MITIRLAWFTQPSLRARCVGGVGLFALCVGAWASSGGAGDVGSACLDVAMAQRFEGRTPAVLVVLSPRMPYALREWTRMKTLAEREGFRVLPLRDPRVPDLEWRQALAASGHVGMADIGALPDEVAARCGLLNHAPAALVGRCGAFHPWPILGVMPDPSWRSTLQARLAKLPGGCE